RRPVFEPAIAVVREISEPVVQYLARGQVGQFGDLGVLAVGADDQPATQLLPSVPGSYVDTGDSSVRVKHQVDDLGAEHQVDVRFGCGHAPQHRVERDAPDAVAVRRATGNLVGLAGPSVLRPKV